MKVLHAFCAFLIATAFKLLLIPSYRSTDFEVHRNWLAITSSKPICEWYFEETSEWTLDYPPLFAYFEYALSFAARKADPKMLQVSNSPYESNQTLLFQRGSVIATDVILFIGAYAVVQASGWSIKSQTWVFMLVVINGGLLLVDHIHFQYNGMLLGLLLASVGAIMAKRHVTAAILLTSLFMMKHLFLTLVPVYLVYLLQAHCIAPAGAKFQTHERFRAFARKFLQLGVAVIAVVILVLAPFATCSDVPAQFSQMLKRLFPFGRGLVHAYWAPNVWALYTVADRALLFAAKRSSLLSRLVAVDVAGLGAASTAGLVGDFGMAVLPSPRPIHTMVLVVLAIVPSMIAVWRNPRPSTFLSSLYLTSLSSFMLGWHIHEKAILIPLILLALLVPNNARWSSMFFRVSTAGVFSLLPLFFTAPENYVKLAIWASYTLFVCWVLNTVNEQWVLRWYDQGMILVFILLGIFAEVVHPLVFKQSNGEVTWPFLPNLLISCSCALVITYCWLESAYLLWKPAVATTSRHKRKRT